MRWLSIIYKRLIQLGKITTPLTFLVAAPYAAWEYRNTLIADRAKLTLEFYDRYNQSPITDYRSSITTALAKYWDKITAAAKSGDAAIDKLTLDIVDSEHLTTSLLQEFDFFDGLKACLDMSLCDQAMAKQLFGTDARNLFVMFFPFIREGRNSGNAQFAVAVEYLYKH